MSKQFATSKRHALLVCPDLARQANFVPQITRYRPCSGPSRLLSPHTLQQQHVLQPWCCSSRARFACRASASSKPETAGVVEYLWLLQAKPDVDKQEMEVLLDSLWSLQYMIPSIMYAAAGTVTGCTLCQGGQGEQTQQQQQQQQRSNQQQDKCPAADTNPTDSSSSSEQSAAPYPPGRFTHAVHYRLSSRSALENLLLHPLMSAMQEHVQALCSNSAHIVFEGTVTKRIEALFRRGDEFASGVEHVLLLQPGSGGGLGADAFLEKLAALAESSVAGGIQASHGAVISCVHTAATHVLMTRFAAQQQVEQLLATPACAAVMQQDPRVPVVAASSLCIAIQPTEESTQVNGGGGPRQLMSYRTVSCRIGHLSYGCILLCALLVGELCMHDRSIGLRLLAMVQLCLQHPCFSI